MFYFKAKNGYNKIITKNGKHVLFKTHPYLGSSIEFDTNKIETQITEMGGFSEGWCELDCYYVVNDVGMNSMEFKKLCQLTEIGK